MLRRVNIFVAIASCFAMAACSAGQQGPQTGSAGIPLVPRADFRAGLPPNENCRGVHGVTVTPCPIVLTKNTKSGIVVEVSGPGVVDSTAQETVCSNGKLCYKINRAVSSDLTQWRVTSGKTCGAADVKFFGLDAAHKRVGYAFLAITNKYCP